MSNLVKFLSAVFIVFFFMYNLFIDAVVMDLNGNKSSDFFEHAMVTASALFVIVCLL